MNDTTTLPYALALAFQAQRHLSREQRAFRICEVAHVLANHQPGAHLSWGDAAAYDILSDGIEVTSGKLLRAPELLRNNTIGPYGHITPFVVGQTAHGPAAELASALQLSDTRHRQALEAMGISGAATEVIRSWIEAHVSAAAALGFGAAAEPAPAGALDPSEGLTATEMGARLGGLSDETVRHREKAGELFSILRPGRKRGREYPAFQAHPAIRGEPLKAVLQVLAGQGGSAAFGFFTSPTEGLGGLTPIEALAGTSSRELAAADQVAAFLASSAEDRLAAVLSAARDHVASLDA